VIVTSPADGKKLVSRQKHLLIVHICVAVILWWETSWQERPWQHCFKASTLLCPPVRNTKEYLVRKKGTLLPLLEILRNVCNNASRPFCFQNMTRNAFDVAGTTHWVEFN